MRFLRHISGAACLAGVVFYGICAQGADKPAPVAVDTTQPKIDESILREGLESTRRGLNFMLSRQNADGSWVDNPAITALACMAIYNSGNLLDPAKKSAAIEKGRAYMLSFVQQDGSIWVSGKKREYPTYTTAIVLASLGTLRYKEDEQIMRNARKFLLGLQLDEENEVNPVVKGSPKYGGFGYGPDKKASAHVDLSNTQWVAEALYQTDYLDREPNAKSPEDTKKADLAWDKVAEFLTSMQHLPETNKAVWVVTDKDNTNYGGFVYRVEDNDNGISERTGREKTLAAYGSMTYAGLKSMIYANLKKDDPRVKAAIEWASKNYTVDSNPGMGSAGLFYYLQTFAKAHAVLGSENVTDKDGKVHNWRQDVVKKLLETQKGEGEWVNENGRWMESNPELVTCYNLLSLELALAPYLK